jgi:hypothetical protein
VWLNSIVAFCIATSPAVQVADTPTNGADARRSSALADSTVFSGRDGQLAATIPHLENPNIEIDSRLDEEAWTRAAVLTGFTQYEPVEGIPGEGSTEVRVFYTSDAIYFSMRAVDSEPHLILAHMGERDRSVFTDDWFRIMLDTFDDHRQAYVFYVNPLGIQTDGLWIEGMQQRLATSVSIDYNPDFLWESDGRVTDDGWVAEIKVPFTTLRFRQAPVQDWGIQLARGIRRKGFKQSWAPLTRNISNTLEQSGSLVGLQGLQPRRLFEVNPVATGKRVGQAVDGVYQQEAFQPDFGLNSRVGLTQNLVLDATFNPDFSQVETDANRITVNERFALFFPEKRPFFLEGTEVFRTPSNLVHTRQIADPIGGAKLTGKIGAFNVGYLGALDEAPKTMHGGDNSAVFNLFRARSDVGGGSTVGVLYTDRSVLRTGRFNRVVAGDARLLFLSRYVFTAQVANSWTSVGSGESVLRAPMVTASLQRSGRSFSFEAKFDDVHGDFRTETGFVPRVGDTELSGRVTAARFGKPGALLQQASIALVGNAFYDHDEFWNGGESFEAEVELHSTLTLYGERILTFIFRDGYFRFRPEDYLSYGTLSEGGEAQPFVVPDRLTHMLAFGFVPRFRMTNAVRLDGMFFYREVPIYREASRGLEVQAAPSITLRPISALELSLGYTYSYLRRQRDHTVFSTAHIPRVRTQYKFSRSLVFRAVVQYSLEESDALRDPATEQPILIDGVLQGAAESGRFESQFLLKYEPSPGTVFFVGYNRLMRGLANVRLSQMELVGEGLFVKASYLFRM